MKNEIAYESVCREKNVAYIYVGTPTITKAIIYTYPNNKKFVGVAKLNREAGDKYDVHFGKKLAYARALDKLYNYNAKIYEARLAREHSYFEEAMRGIAKQMQKNNDISEKANELYHDLVINDPNKLTEESESN